MKTPMVFDDKCAENRQDGAKKLHHYWKQLWDSQDWTEEERISKAALIADSIREKVPGSLEGDRPSLQEFQCGLKRISGTHGIDGWASSELKAIAAVPAAAEMVWNAMELWEDTSLLPDCVAHCKLVCVPKKDKRLLSPNEYRPICVMSSLWRVWSTTWIRSSSISQWTRSLFPSTVSGDSLAVMERKLWLQWWITRCTGCITVLAWISSTLSTRWTLASCTMLSRVRCRSACSNGWIWSLSSG